MQNQFIMRIKKLFCNISTIQGLDRQRVSTVSRFNHSLYMQKEANAKGSVSGFEIAPPSKDNGNDKQLAVN